MGQGDVERVAVPGPGLLVYFHGHDSTPRDVDSFFRDPHADGWTRLCPTGPCRTPAAHAWFETGPRGVLWPTLEANVELACSVISEARRGLVGDDGAVVLGGFSQGAAFALAVAAAMSGEVRGLLLQSPFLPESVDGEVDLAGGTLANGTTDGAGVGVPDALGISPASSPRRGARVLVHLSRHDEVVPPMVSRDVADLLRTTGATVEVEEFDGGHRVTVDMVASAAAWLRSLTPKDPAR